MTLAENLESLVARAVELAEAEKKPDLVGEAYGMANTFDKGIKGVADVAGYCMSTSMVEAIVACCKRAVASTELMREQNDKLVERMVNLGATPEVPELSQDPGLGPPWEEEPIRDHEQPPVSRVE
jgi:hypothetical protein